MASKRMKLDLIHLKKKKCSSQYITDLLKRLKFLEILRENPLDFGLDNYLFIAYNTKVTNQNHAW